jgi:hypothetical protein
MSVFNYEWAIEGDEIVETTRQKNDGAVINQITLAQLWVPHDSLDAELLRSGRQLREACLLMLTWLESAGGYGEAIEEQIVPLLGVWNPNS